MKSSGHNLIAQKSATFYRSRGSTVDRGRKKPADLSKRKHSGRELGNQVEKRSDAACEREGRRNQERPGGGRKVSISRSRMRRNARL